MRRRVAFIAPKEPKPKFSRERLMAMLTKARAGATGVRTRRFRGETGRIAWQRIWPCGCLKMRAAGYEWREPCLPGCKGKVAHA